MVAILFRFLLFIFLLWLLQAVLKKLFSSTTRRRPASGESPSNNMVKDPVCGMYMDSRLAVRLESRTEAFYFCSEECKNKYLDESAAAQSSNLPPM